MLRFVRAMVRGVGWLLTPAIVAATSAGALWLGARLGTRIASAKLALATAVGIAVGAGTAVFLWWVLSLRHARRHARRTVAPAARPMEPDARPEVVEPMPTAAVAVPASSSVDEAAD